MKFSFKSVFRRNRNSDNTPPTTTDAAVSQSKSEEIFKAYIPNFLYKPPYGMPRRVNTVNLKALSVNPYVFSVIKTLADEATSVGWEIKIKEEFQETFDVEATTSAEKGEKLMVQMNEKIRDITKFFKNPNGNEQSWEHIMRQLIFDLQEVDSAVIVKVFNRQGEFKQMFARDGSLFLKNPDIYGYMGNRADFVMPLPDGFLSADLNDPATNNTTQQIMKQYSLLYKDQAAYFQYGWTAGSMPVPFGKREVVYMMQNPRSDSIYGRSPVQVLEKTILNLVYGSEVNLDYYTNNNMPDGVIQLLGAQAEQLKHFRENMENQFKYKDEFGNERKRYAKIPLATGEVKFTKFQLSAAELEIIAQQQWFTKILWMCFGVTADEMGFTETSNKTSGENQTKLAKRKALKPLLAVISNHLNSEIMPEFFAEGTEIPDSGDVPLEFVFDTYDLDDDMKELSKLQLEINMGIKTPKMVAIERGINIEELEAQKEEIAEEEPDENTGNPGEKKKEANPGKEEKEKPKIKEKAQDTLSEIDGYLDDLGEQVASALEGINDNELKEKF